jgi:hypothetical protein
MTQQNQQNPGQQVLLVLLRVSQANLSKIQPGKAAAGQRDQATRHGGLAIGALPIIKKSIASHCIICSTFGKVSFMPEFQRSASGL